MPFTVSPSSYVGGQLLAGGIGQAAQSISGAIQHFAEINDQASQGDALMQYLSQQTDPATGKPVISKSALEDYMHHSARQRSYIAGGQQAGMAAMQALGHYTSTMRKDLAETNLATAHAASLANQTTTPQGGQVNIGGRKINFVQAPGGHVTLVPETQGTPGQVVTDPNTGKAIGVFGQDGKFIRYQAGAAPFDYNAVFGSGAPTAAAPPTPAPGQAPTGPQSSDQAWSTQGDPGNLPPQLRQTPPGQPVAPTAPQQGPAGGQVRVMHPDGKTVGYIPADQLAAAVKLGYTQM